MKARNIWIGPSALNGELVSVLAKVGANSKVTGKASRVLAMAVIPVETMRYILRPEFSDIPGGHMGGKYIESIRETIDAACHNDCEHKRNGKCYAQFNAQSTTEAVKMIRDAGMPRGEWGETQGSQLSRALTMIIDANELGDGDRARLMIVGSTGALPIRASRRIVDTVRRRGLSMLAYVENWRTRPDLRDSHMASCYSMEDVREAEAMGWRAFYSPNAETLGNTVPDGMSMCPSSKYRENAGRVRVGCADCGLCDGAKGDDKRSHILNIRHGNGDASRVAGLVRKGILGRLIVNGRGRTVGAYAK